MELMALASAVNQEEQRYVCEKFESNKEWFLYYMLFWDEVTKDDIKAKKGRGDQLKKIKN